MIQLFLQNDFPLLLIVKHSAICHSFFMVFVRKSFCPELHLKQPLEDLQGVLSINCPSVEVPIFSNLPLFLSQSVRVIDTQMLFLFPEPPD